MGLGLSIVQRLGNLLGHRVKVRSCPGKGSVFSIEVELQTAGTASCRTARSGDGEVTRTKLPADRDDSDRRRRSRIARIAGTNPYGRPASRNDGSRWRLGAETGDAGAIQPDLIIADYNLPNGMDGLRTAVKLRQHFHREIPVIIMTGDISTDTLRSVRVERCVQLHKPVTGEDLLKTIQRMLAVPPASAPPARRLRDGSGPSSSSWRTTAHTGEYQHSAEGGRPCRGELCGRRIFPGCLSSRP